MLRLLSPDSKNSANEATPTKTTLQTQARKKVKNSPNTCRNKKKCQASRTIT